MFAHVVPQKRVDADHSADGRHVLAGLDGFVARSDNEPTILKLLRHAVTEARIKVEDLSQVRTEHPNIYDFVGN